MMLKTLILGLLTATSVYASAPAAKRSSAAATMPDSKAVLEKLAAPLIVNNKQNTASVIRRLSLLPLEEREPFVKLVTQLTKRNPVNAVSIIMRLSTVPEDERATLVGLIADPKKGLLQPTKDNAVNLLDELIQIPAVERDSCVKLNNLLLPPNSGYSECVLKEIRLIPSAEREPLVKLIFKYAKKLLAADGDHAADIIGLMHQIPLAEREDLVMLATNPANALIDPRREYTYHVLRELSLAKVDERESLVRLIRNQAKLLISDDRGNTARILHELAQVQIDERESLVRLVREHAIQFISDDRKNAAAILHELAQVPLAEREPLVRFIIEHSADLVSVNRFNMANVFEQLRQIPEAERTPIVRLIADPPTRLITEGRVDVFYTLLHLRQIPEQERTPIVRLITAPETRLVSDERCEAGYLLQKLYQMPEDERATIARLITDPATRLIQVDRNDSGRVLSYIVDSIPHGQRYTRLARAFLFLRGQQMDRNRFRSIIERDLTTPIPPEGAGMMAMGDMENPYEAGINVHDGDRDARTADALKVLWESQGALSDEVIDMNYREFRDYLETQKESVKADVMRVLDSQVSSEWGGLLKGRVTTAGLDTTGQELLARFWLFAKTGDEQENKKSAIITALKNSIDHGAVVCNPGKLQRLATFVLQGYLRGVNIDGNGFVPAAMAAPAMGGAGGPDLPLVEAAPEHLNVISNREAIAYYLKPLYERFQMEAPTSAEDLFRRTIEYVERLRFGEVLGADPVHLDLREVIHLLAVGEGDGFSVAESYPGMFGIDDYMEQFGVRDQVLRDMADQEGARRRAEAEALERARIEEEHHAAAMKPAKVSQKRRAMAEEDDDADSDSEETSESTELKRTRM
jgi:hypothetical protein